MSEYGPGLSFEQVCSLNRERIMHAIRNELVCNETRKGFVYAPCSTDEAERYILSAYDEAVYQAQQALHASRALEYILKQHNIEPNTQEYLEAMSKTSMSDPGQKEDFLKEEVALNICAGTQEAH